MYVETFNYFDSFEEGLQAALELSTSLSVALHGATDFEDAVAIATAYVFSAGGWFRYEPVIIIAPERFELRIRNGIELILSLSQEDSWFTAVRVPRDFNPEPRISMVAMRLGWGVWHEPYPPEPGDEQC